MSVPTNNVIGNGTNIGVVRGVINIGGDSVYGSHQDTRTGEAYWTSSGEAPVGLTTDGTKSGMIVQTDSRTKYIIKY